MSKKKITNPTTTNNLFELITPTAIALFVIIVLTILLRLHALDIPLERDEGEYAYAGQLILDGYPPYQHVYNMKLPGIYYTYAGLMAIFGETTRGIHLGLVLFNIISIILIYQLVASFSNRTSALAAAGCYAVLSASQSVLGLSANAEHFVLVPALLGILFMNRALKAPRNWMIFVSGACLGIAFIIKQQGAVFAIFTYVYLVISFMRIRPFSLRSLIGKSAWFSLGVGIPYILTCLLMMYYGVFHAFWFWTVKYAQAYSSIVPLSRGLSYLQLQAVGIVGSSPLIWFLVLIGTTTVLIDKQLKEHRPVILLFVLFSFMAVCPGLYFRAHYFIFFLPAAAMLGGLSTLLITNLISRFVEPPLYRQVILIAILSLCISEAVYEQRYLFQLTPMQISRATYGDNPFPESVEISRFINAYTKENESVAVLGSEPQIFFYAHRRSATGFIYMYPLMEPHAYALKMQTDLIKEIESSRPKILVFVNIPFSWLARPDSKNLIFNWADKYQKTYYRLIGIIDISGRETQYSWEPNIIPPRSSSFISLYERKRDS